ncbi:MAG: hypothetical protein WCF68_09320 [Terriglobales bacterium]
MFTPHPNLSDEVNRNLIASEIEGGVFLDQLQPYSVLQIQTQHRCYTAVMLGENQALISGHPEYCPEPTLVAIAGSTWGGSMLKQHFVGRGMHLEFCHPQYPTPIVTSRVQEIRECIEQAPVLNQAAPPSEPELLTQIPLVTRSSPARRTSMALEATLSDPKL